MVLSSSARQMGEVNEVTGEGPALCTGNASSKELLYYYLKKEYKPLFQDYFKGNAKTNEGISTLGTQQALRGRPSVTASAAMPWSAGGPHEMPTHPHRLQSLFSQQQ